MELAKSQNNNKHLNIGIANQKIVLLMIFFASLLYFLLGSRMGLNLYEEGGWLYAACRILNGEIPYRDFWIPYTPGHYYTLAALFWLFGESVMVARLFGVVVCALIAFCVYWVAQKVSTRSLAMLSWFITVSWLAWAGYGSAGTSGLLLSIVSCIGLIKYINSRRWVWLLLTGISIGLTTIFRHDFGFYVFVAVSIVTVLFIFRNTVGAGINKEKAVLKALQGWCVLLSGMMVLLVPVFAFLWVTAGPNELFENLVLFPLTVFPKYRQLPWPSLFANPLDVMSGELSIGKFIRIFIGRIIFYLPLTFFLTMAQIRLFLGNKKKFSETYWIVLLFLLFGICFLNYALVRSDSAHLAGTNIAVAILLASALLAFKKKQQFGQHHILRVVVSFLTILSLICFGYFFIRYTGRAVSSHWSSQFVSLNRERVKGIRQSRKRINHLWEAVNYIQEKVPSREKIFVGNQRHDNIHYTHTMFYFVSKRHSATKYHGKGS